MVEDNSHEKEEDSAKMNSLMEFQINCAKDESYNIKVGTLKDIEEKGENSTAK